MYRAKRTTSTRTRSRAKRRSRLPRERPGAAGVGTRSSGAMAPGSNHKRVRPATPRRRCDRVPAGLACDEASAGVASGGAVSAGAGRVRLGGMDHGLEALVSVAVGIGLAAACGFRVFVPLLALSAAAFTG